MALAYINEGFMILSALSVAFGWMCIRRRHVALHRKVMLFGAACAVAFFVTYVLKTLLVGDTTFGGPKNLAGPYLVFLQSHTILATGVAVMGIFTLRYAFRRRFKSHRKLAPWTAGLWFVAAATGLTVFLMLYVIFPPGPTTNIIRAVTGG